MSKDLELQVQYDIVIPVFEWKQVGGDMNPGAHGGVIARADGTCVEIREIQPVCAFVGDDEGAEVGYPFWCKDGYFDVADLDPNKDSVRSALQYCGLDLQDVPAEYLAVTIAECLLSYGAGDEGDGGWADDVVPAQVEWWGGKVAGPEYLSDEDLEYAQLLASHGADMCGKAGELVAEYLAKALESDIAAMCETLADVHAECEEPCGECSEVNVDRIDVRLQLQAVGTWDIHSGNASYDTDHHGFWGASVVCHDDTEATLSETVRDLIAQALDAIVQ